MNETAYNVRVYKTKVYKGKKVTTYTVCWKVGDREWTEPFRNAAQADSFRSALLTAARKGEAFSTTTGQPVTWQQAATEMSWYDFASAYADMNGKPRRRSTAGTSRGRSPPPPSQCSRAGATASPTTPLYAWRYANGHSTASSVATHLPP